MRGRGLGAAAAALFGMAALASGAGATGPAVQLGSDGETAPVYSYADAIRQHVWVSVPGVDQDGDGVDDRVSIDIIRPQETQSGLQVPAIIFASPYFSSLGTGGAQFLHWTAGVPDRFPGFYDNYFVPRGYAVVLAEANGTGFSTGCPLHGGPGDIASMKAVVDWLQGRDQGYDAQTGGNAVTATWDNGKAAMIGKSYDGTLANGVAATGVSGLTTIVPLSPISNWYDYSRSNGIRENTHYPASLSQSISHNTAASTLGDGPAGRDTLCAGTRSTMSTQDGDDTGDVNAFWSARDYTQDVGNVTASVFESFGLNDDNVKTDQLGPWWAGLAANDVPRKLWLSQEGHVDPFDYNRDAWVDTLHRWFDYWLLDVDNGIMSEPPVTIETSANTYENDSDWPVPGTADVGVYLNGTSAGAAGVFGATSGGGSTASLSFTDLATQSETSMLNNPTGSQASRLVFLSPVLKHSLRISGTPTVDLQAALDKAGGNLGAILVDYSTTPFSQSGRAGSDGIAQSSTSTCEGDTVAPDVNCFPDYTKPLQSNLTRWRVAKGILDTQNRSSLLTPSVLVPDQSYGFTWPLLPNDYTFQAGHQVGVVLVSAYSSYPEASGTDPYVPTVTVDTHQSRVLLPVVGGGAAAQAAGLFDYDTTAPTLRLPPVVREATGAATTVTYDTASATDDTDPSPSFSCTPASGTTFTIGTTTVQCQAQDASGNAASGQFDVTVQDTTAPTLHVPAAVSSDATADAGVSVTYSATATDLVDSSPTVSCLPASGSTFPIGTSTVACTAADSHGNTSTGSFVVTVNDKRPLPPPPVIVLDTLAPALHLPSQLAAPATSRLGAVVSYAASATDDLDPSPSLSCLPASGSTFALGTTTVQCTSADRTGNTSRGSFTIVVQDTTAPSLDVPDRIAVDAATPTGARVAYRVRATDAVDPSPALSCRPQSGSTFAIGVTTVRCTATDDSGNTARASFVVEVRGAKAVLRGLGRNVKQVLAELGAHKHARACIDLASLRRKATSKKTRAELARVERLLRC